VTTITGDLYRLDFANGKSYVGASTRGTAGNKKAEKRYVEHEREAILQNSQHPVHVAWRNYGSPKLVVLQRNVPAEKLWSEEKKAIIKYNTKVPNGYNGYFGRDTAPGMLGKKLNKEQKDRIGLGHRGRKDSEQTKKKKSQAMLEHYKKHPRTEETKQKISKANSGRKQTEEEIESRRRANTGKKRTNETKQRLSDALSNYYKNNVVSSATRKKQRDAHLGVPLSENHKASLSRVQTGKKHSESRRKNERRAQRKRFKNNPVSIETRNKQSVSARKRWAKK